MTFLGSTLASVTFFTFWLQGDCQSLIKKIVVSGIWTILTWCGDESLFLSWSPFQVMTKPPQKLLHMLKVAERETIIII